MDIYHTFVLPQRTLLPSPILEARMGHSKVDLFHPSHPCLNTDSNFDILERWQAQPDNLKARLILIKL